MKKMTSLVILSLLMLNVNPLMAQQPHHPECCYYFDDPAFTGPAKRTLSWALGLTEKKCASKKKTPDTATQAKCDEIVYSFPREVDRFFNAPHAEKRKDISNPMSCCFLYKNAQKMMKAHHYNTFVNYDDYITRHLGISHKMCALPQPKATPWEEVKCDRYMAERMNLHAQGHMKSAENMSWYENFHFRLAVLTLTFISFIVFRERTTHVLRFIYDNYIKA